MQAGLEDEPRSSARGVPREKASSHKKLTQNTTDSNEDREQLHGVARNFDKVFDAALEKYELIPTIHELDLLLDSRDARQEGRL